MAEKRDKPGKGNKWPRWRPKEKKPARDYADEPIQDNACTQYLSTNRVRDRSVHSLDDAYGYPSFGTRPNKDGKSRRLVKREVSFLGDSDVVYVTEHFVEQKIESNGIDPNRPEKRQKFRTFFRSFGIEFLFSRRPLPKIPPENPREVINEEESVYHFPDDPDQSNYEGACANPQITTRSSTSIQNQSDYIYDSCGTPVYEKRVDKGSIEWRTTFQTGPYGICDVEPYPDFKHKVELKRQAKTSEVTGKLSPYTDGKISVGPGTPELPTEDVDETSASSAFLVVGMAAQGGFGTSEHIARVHTAQDFSVPSTEGVPNNPNNRRGDIDEKMADRSRPENCLQNKQIEKASYQEEKHEETATDDNKYFAPPCTNARPLRSQGLFSAEEIYLPPTCIIGPPRISEELYSTEDNYLAPTCTSTNFRGKHEGEHIYSKDDSYDALDNQGNSSDNLEDDELIYMRQKDLKLKKQRKMDRTKIEMQRTINDHMKTCVSNMQTLRQLQEESMALKSEFENVSLYARYETPYDQIKEENQPFGEVGNNNNGGKSDGTCSSEDEYDYIDLK